MSKKHTYEYIKAQIEATGHKLLSKRYENAHTDLKIESPDGNVFKMRWSSFQQGGRYARYAKRAGRNKYDLDFIKKEVKKLGYTVLSKRYKNAHSFLKLRCKCGNIFKRLWDDVYNRNAQCPYCRGYFVDSSNR